jgi:cephalosporin-C deacetylase-like acetyl esterase
MYQPSKYFYKLYENERILKFKAKNIEEWKKWKFNLKNKLIELLGIYPEEIDLNPQILEEKNYDDYIREKVIFNSTRDIEVVGYLLIPKFRKFPIPGILAIHGHGYGKDDIVGINQDGSERKIPLGYQKDFALTLVKNGFVVFAIEQMGFGERREEEDIRKGRDKSSCRKLSFFAMMLGKTLLGIRVWDAIRSIDFLQSLSEVKKDSIGIVGISGGGTTSLFTSALDERIKATVISGYLNTFKDSILAIEHCECNYIPGILKYAEMYDIASLIAPRYLFIEHGIYDDIFPINATKFAISQLEKVYEFLGVSNNLEYEFFDGKHEICGNKSFIWLKEKLNE